MRLQIAVDIGGTDQILQIADAVYDVIDIFEVGTPVIMREGLRPVRRLKERYPDMTVLADSKIVDGGAIEAEDICKASADILTVLAFADNATISEVVETAHRYGTAVMADLICISSIGVRAKQLLEMGVDYIAVHTGIDMQASGRTPLRDLEELVTAIPPQKTAVAGGISRKTLPLFVRLQPEIIIAGSALYKAPDIKAAVLDMKKELRP